MALLLSPLSFADEYVAAKIVFSLSGCNAETVAEVCTCAVGRVTGSYEARLLGASESTRVCRYEYHEKGTAGGWTLFSQTIDGLYSCPSGYSSAGNGLCVRSEPPAENKCSDKNPYVRAWFAGNGYGYPQGDNGCAITVLAVEKCYSWSTGVNAGKTICYYLVKRTGAPYSGGEGGGPPPPPSTSNDQGGGSTPEHNPPPGNSCPAGTMQIGTRANGDPICVPTGTGAGGDNPPSAPPKTTTSSQTAGPGGSTVKTDATVSRNSDGSQTINQTVTTTSSDGKNVTVEQSRVTTKTASGAAGREDLPEDRANLCKMNPNLNICRNSTTSGTCGQIACTGDAIQCATLRAAAIMECRGQADIDELSASGHKVLGDAIGSGNDPMKGQIEEMLRGTEVDVSGTALDTAGFLGGGSCLAPMSFSVRGQSVVYSFDALCAHIVPLRVLVMAICTLFGYLVVARSVIGG
jgi:hypothetical protein